MDPWWVIVRGQVYWGTGHLSKNQFVCACGQVRFELVHLSKTQLVYSETQHVYSETLD